VRLYPDRSDASGFTLIEILIVMVIVGILATLVTLKIGNRAVDDRLQTEAERFEQLVKLAQDESQVKGIPIGLRFTTSGYQFLAINDKGQWAEYGQGALRPRPLIPPFYAEVQVDGRSVAPAQDQQSATSINDQSQKILPQILLLPGGESSAFAVDVKAQNYLSYFHVESDALGRIQFERRSLQ
jgi:general secretion pathway protein H